MTEEGGRRRVGAARWLRGLGLALSLAAVAWVVWPLWRQGRDLAGRVDAGELATWVVAGAFLYAVVSVLLGLAWWWLAGVYGERPSALVGYAVHARSQLAKYLPTNALHYVSRQLLGRTAGLGHPALVASGVFEMASLLVAAMAVALAGLGLAADREWARTAWLVGPLAAVAALAAWPAADALLRRLAWSRRFMAELPRLSLAGTARLFAVSVPLHALFFVATGGVLWLLVVAADGPTDAWRTLLWLYPLAWMAGTVTIGAPAGLGVREAILVLELSTLLDPPRAALVALAFRLATTGGDLLTAAAGWLAARSAGGDGAG
ncbi:MAG TPA: lysylphosphatidylglycerol synthase domain-containing protein [Thermoanaerobaculia bacterium]|nr:lysylphosphatidylglycerol synthase domain-containing protein [Thermoanaerobaculia bacterium]